MPTRIWYRLLTSTVMKQEHLTQRHESVVKSANYCTSTVPLLTDASAYITAYSVSNLMFRVYPCMCRMCPAPKVQSQ